MNFIAQEIVYLHRIFCLSLIGNELTEPSLSFKLFKTFPHPYYISLHRRRTPAGSPYGARPCSGMLLVDSGLWLFTNAVEAERLCERDILRMHIERESIGAVVAP